MNFFLKVSPTKKYICHAVISGTIFNSILFFSNYSLTSQIIFRTPCQKKVGESNAGCILGGVKLHVRNQPKVVQRKSMRFVKWQNSKENSKFVLF